MGSRYPAKMFGVLAGHCLALPEFRSKGLGVGISAMPIEKMEKSSPMKSGLDVIKSGTEN
jgi:hypothetical protein